MQLHGDRGGVDLEGVDVNALELADQLDHDSDIGELKHYEASAMLRKQNEAIRQLREALANLERVSGLASMWDDEGRKAARAALAATEEICKN